MALPNGLSQVSDLGSLQGSLGYNIVDIPLMTATAASGSPAAGTFHSTITNRAPMYDLRKDLGVRMGNNRISTQQTYPIQNEYGPNGETVYGVINDYFGQVRLVGDNVAVNFIDTYGPRFNVGIGNYVEITFYGTGLNVICLQDVATRQFNAQVDGGAAGPNLFPANGSSILGDRKYPQNTIINAASNLTIGVHTVRINSTGSGGQPIPTFGFEVLNEQFLTTTANINSSNQLTSVANTTNLAVGMDITGVNIPANTTISSISGSTITMSAAATATTVGITVRFGNNFIKVNPGTSWKNGQKLYNPTQHLSAYNSGFESGTLGSRGGRVAVYQKANGSIAKAVNPVGSQLNLAAADHSNEEGRVLTVDEFSASRTDDITGPGSSEADRAFTLDDGTLTLSGRNIQFINQSGVPNSIQVGASSPNFYANITFTGTGLDIEAYDTFTSINTHAVSIDGATTIGNIPNVGTASLVRIRKIVSGLPYGTHTVKLTATNNIAGGLRITKFITYQPKTPTIPTDASLIGTYNILANYDGTTATGTATADNIQMPIGILSKSPAREMTYVGTGFSIPITGIVESPPHGFYTATNTNGEYYEYTFFGTGISLHHRCGGAATTMSILIDGVLDATGVSRASFTNNGGGAYTGVFTAGGNPQRLEFTGLALGKHTIRVTRAGAGTGALNLWALNVITPIHSYKDNGPFVVQNTLAIGSQGVSDSRRLASQVNQQQISQAVDLGANTTTSVTEVKGLADISTIIKVSKYGNLDIEGLMTLTNAANNGAQLQIYVNGVPFGKSMFVYATVGMASAEANIIVKALVPVSPGIYKVNLYWNASSGFTATGERRTLTVKFSE